ncbi:uncharacterized protein METZ01_LOCUS479438 [marine metagenome]|uniref:Uncharacterized protein n=1 Tax=marine metagenome TaxID=408172 RepID=A0A383C327_9ZZZZ
MIDITEFKKDLSELTERLVNVEDCL